MNSLKFLGLSSLLFSAVLSQGENGGSGGDTSSTNECDDAYECSGNEIEAYYIYCRGYYSCSESLLNSTYQINWGAYGAYYALIETSNTIYAHGVRVNYAATVATNYLLSYGYQSSAYSDIEPYSHVLEIFFYGYYAGYYSSVFCRSGEICTIYCGDAFGCYGASFYCYSGATCQYNCDEDEDYCPTLFSGYDTTIIGGGGSGSNSLNAESDISIRHIGMLSDEQIDNYRHAREQTRQIKMELKSENDIKLIEMAQKRDTKNSRNNPGGLLIPKLDLNEMSKILTVIDNNNDKTREKHYKNKNKNSFVDKINNSELGPLVYGLIGSFLTILLLICRYKCHSKRKVCNKGHELAEYRPILA